MASVLLMNFLDVARSLGLDPLNATPEKVATFITREFKRSGGAFNYNTSIISLFDLFRGASTLQEAEDYCAEHGAPAGWGPNVQAIRLAGSYAIERQSNCYRTSFAAVAIGRLTNDRTAYMAIKTPLVRVEGDRVFVVVPGFRMSHRPVDVEIDVAASLALAHFGRDDFHDADFEYLYAGPGSTGEREFQAFHGRSRRVFDLDAVDHLLDIYVRGLSLAVDQGISAPAPNFRGYRVVDGDQPGFFD